MRQLWATQAFYRFAAAVLCLGLIALLLVVSGCGGVSAVPRRPAPVTADTGVDAPADATAPQAPVMLTTHAPRSPARAAPAFVLEPIDAALAPTEPQRHTAVAIPTALPVNGAFSPVVPTSGVVRLAIRPAPRPTVVPAITPLPWDDVQPQATEPVGQSPNESSEPAVTEVAAAKAAPTPAPKSTSVSIVDAPAGAGESEDPESLDKQPSSSVLSIVTPGAARRQPSPAPSSAVVRVAPAPAASVPVAAPNVAMVALQDGPQSDHATDHVAPVEPPVKAAIVSSPAPAATPSAPIVVETREATAERARSLFAEAQTVAPASRPSDLTLHAVRDLPEQQGAAPSAPVATRRTMPPVVQRPIMRRAPSQIAVRPSRTEDAVQTRPRPAPAVASRRSTEQAPRAAVIVAAKPNAPRAPQRPTVAAPTPATQPTPTVARRTPVPTEPSKPAQSSTAVAAAPTPRPQLPTLPAAKPQRPQIATRPQPQPSPAIAQSPPRAEQPSTQTRSVLATAPRPAQRQAERRPAPQPTVEPPQRSVARTIIKLPPAMPASHESVSPRSSGASDEPTVRIALAPNKPVEGPAFARPAPVRPAIPPAAAQPPQTLVRSRQMQIVALKAAEQARAGFSLAERGAMFAARREFIQALRQLAVALDVQEGGDAHATALAAGLRALDESSDFVPTGTQLEADMDVAGLVVAHQTPVLKDAPVETLSPLRARQAYYTYAQEQLAKSVGRERAGSLALYGLGKLHTAFQQEKTPNIESPESKAIVYFQAAMMVDPRNYMAGNEVAVLLARNGCLEAARAILLQCVMTSPQPSAWHNLSVVHQYLGETTLAEMAARESQVAASKHPTAAKPMRPGSVPTHAVQWVAPDQFAATSRPITDANNPNQSTLESPVPGAVAPRTAQQPESGAGFSLPLFNKRK